MLIIFQQKSIIEINILFHHYFLSYNKKIFIKQKMKKKIEKEAVSPLLKYVRPGLNLHDLQQFKSVFDLFDTTKSGLINAKDLKNAIAQQGKQALGTPIYQLVCDLDEEGRGSIDFESFLFFLTQTVTGDQPEAEMRKLFALFDDEKTGFISLSGLRRLTKYLHVHVDQKDVQQMMRQADADKDGFVSFQEFSQILSYRHH